MSDQRLEGVRSPTRGSEFSDGAVDGVTGRSGEIIHRGQGELGYSCFLYSFISLHLLCFAMNQTPSQVHNHHPTVNIRLGASA